jgi:hypothetical protein
MKLTYCPEIDSLRIFAVGDVIDCNAYIAILGHQLFKE